MTLNVLLCSGVGPYHTNNRTALHPKPYDEFPLVSIRDMLDVPQNIPKEASRWVLFTDHKSRSSAELTESASYYALWADIDTGNHQPREIERVVCGLECEAWLYTSRGSEPSNIKWRIIIPLDKPISAQYWITVQEHLIEFLASHKIEADKSAARPNQVCYLPNRGGRYYGFVTGHSGILFSPPAEWFFKSEKQEAQRKAVNRLTHQLQTNALTAIEFNRSNPLETLLEKYNYEKIGGRWRSPNASDKSTPAVVTSVINGIEKWYSHHESDESTVGTHGDAFDLYTFYEHGGDVAAAFRSLGEEAPQGWGVTKK